MVFRFLYSPAPDGVHVFESPVDLMSWFTLRGLADAVALCGLHDAPLEAYLNDYPHIGRIVLCLDADVRGREASERLADKYGERGFKIVDKMPPAGKDWNEYLQMKGGP